MYELIETLQDYHIAEALIGLSVLLVLIDYFFPTDVPAHFGYFCFGAGMFFLVPLGLSASAAVGVGIWLLLALLHQLLFRRFLTNAPGTEDRYDEADEQSSPSQPPSDSQ